MTRVLIVLTLLCAAAGARAAEPYYFVTVHNSVAGAGYEGSYKALEKMVQLADSQHVRLTLLFSAQYAAYISTDPARAAQLESWKNAGHEIGAYHQGPDTRDWDGFSDLRGEALARARGSAVPGAVPGHADYFFMLGGLAPKIRSGCVAGRADKEFLAAAPEYEVCPGGSAAEGANRWLFSSGGRRRLSSASPSGRAGVQAAEKVFSGMKGGVYGAAFKSSPSEFGAFYAWLQFLKGRDPRGGRSRTVSAVVEEKLLAEKVVREEKAARAERTVKPELPARTIVIPDIPEAADTADIPDADGADEAEADREPQDPEIPRLKPVHSPYSRVERLFFGRFRPLRQAPRPAQRRYCGDGICDMVERRHPGSCARDCGR
ncbi:MAG: hypothetical protein WCK76_05765 [Elusimicrobiota bacterium]